MTAKKEWTFKQAQAAQSRFQKQGGTVRGPLFEWAALHELDELAKRFKSGDRHALMLAIRECANFDLAMPDWVSRGYIRAFDTVNNYRAKSWDEVFGRAIPKGAQIKSLRKKREKSAAVWIDVLSRHKGGESIDDELFSSVGKKHGLGLTITKEFYADWKKRMPPAK